MNSATNEWNKAHQIGEQFGRDSDEYAEAKERAWLAERQSDIANGRVTSPSWRWEGAPDAKFGDRVPATTNPFRSKSHD